MVVGGERRMRRGKPCDPQRAPLKAQTNLMSDRETGELYYLSLYVLAKVKGTWFWNPWKNLYIFSFNFCIYWNGVNSKPPELELLDSAPDGCRTRPALSCRNKVVCRGGGTRKAQA